MHACTLLFVVLLVVLPVSGWEGAGQEKKPESLAGWYGVFTDLTNYGRRFEAPFVDPERKTTAYRQTAVYEWLGGRLETISVTLARDPNFKTQFSAAGIRQRAPEAVAIQVRGLKGWLLDSNQLVLVLGEDRALIIRRQGDGPDLAQVAQQFNLTRVVQALAQPPRRDTSRKLEYFRGLKVGSYSDLQAWVGNPDDDVGSGIHVLVYGLADGSRVLIGTPDLRRLLYIRHVQKNGQTEELAK